jgi:hypothetical protein
MKTLPRAIIAQVLTDPSKYHALRRRWSALMRSTDRQDLAAEHHLLYLALIGKDWRKGFTCPTNARKLENGAFYGWALFHALAIFHSSFCDQALIAPFDGIVTAEMLRRVRQLVLLQNVYHYQPEQFTQTSFPFEAYRVPNAAQANAADERNVNA